MILDIHGKPIGQSTDSALRGWSQRRWESAETSRLNSAHWSKADGRTINEDLISYGQVLWHRIAYEIANNPIIAGMIETHKADLIGAEGPTLRVVTSDDDRDNAYARQLEEGWEDWWESPDINGILSGPDLLRQWIQMFWQCGEVLVQHVTDNNAGTPVSLRLHSLHPRRLATPPGRESKRYLAMGVLRTKTGKPRTYYIDQAPEDDLLSMTGEFVGISAQNITHIFEQQEPGQIRGVPWLATVLQVAADIRDYDVQVLDAARQAADSGVILHTDHPDAPFMLVNEDVEVVRRRERTAPPGWKPMQIKAEQPTTNYPQYRTERHRDLGRPRAMPAMVVRLDSSSHNFSSARFDAQMYGRVNAATQHMMARIGLNPMVRTVETELLRAGAAGDSRGITARRPRRVKFEWGWPPALYRAADPVKEAKGQAERLRNRTTTLADELAAEGRNFERHIEQLVRESNRLREAGLLPPAESGDEDRAGAERWIAELFARAIEEHAGSGGGAGADQQEAARA